MEKVLLQLKKWGACPGGYKWSLQFDDVKTWWESFDGGDWMLWVCGRLGGEPESEARKKLVLAACKCAREALPFVAEGETRPLKAIETAEGWAKGDENITLEDVRKATIAAADAGVEYADAGEYAASHAASAAVYAADAAAYAEHADGAELSAVSAAGYADAREKILKRCADIVREFYTWQDIRDAIYAIAE